MYLSWYCPAEFKGQLGELNPCRGGWNSLKHHIAGTVWMGSTCWTKQEERSRLHTYIRMMLDTWIRMICLGADNVALLKGSPASVLPHLAFRALQRHPSSKLISRCRFMWSAWISKRHSTRHLTHQRNLRTMSSLEIEEKYERSGLTGEEDHQRSSILGAFSITCYGSTCSGEEGSLLVRNCLMDALSMFSDSRSTRANSAL